LTAPSPKPATRQPLDDAFFSTLLDATDRDTALPGINLVATLLKRWLAGTLHGCVSNDHLPYYLDEYIFRFNRRTARKRGLLVYDSFSKP
jgi:hypothetical protein